MAYKIAILASGSGTNAENIARYFADSDLGRVTLVLTNVRDAGVVGRMHTLGIDTYYVPNSEWREHPERIAEFLSAEGIELVVLAGFMRKVDDRIVERFRGRMLNIHPSLLPAYGGPGMYGHHVHEAVIAAGEMESGVTVHQVSEVMDGGEIVAQERVEILPGETPESLEQKIHQVEYALYPQAIEQVLSSMDEEAADGNPVMDGNLPDEPEIESEEVSVPPVPPTYEEQPPAYHEQPAEGAAQPPMPSTCLLWAVLCTAFCCLPAGVVAILFSCRVSTKYYRGDYAGAEKASWQAQLWIIISFCIGVLQATIFSPIYYLLAG